MTSVRTSQPATDLVRLRGDSLPAYRQATRHVVRRRQRSRIAQALFVLTSGVSLLDLYLLARSIPHL